MTGFANFEVKQAFDAGRLRKQRGAPDAAICGARTKGGSLCQGLPLKGGKRCLRHAGRYAALAHRERQREAFMSGKISADEWRLAEARRAANRLQYRWRSDPWLPGATIDLGQHEEAFRAAVGGSTSKLDELPAAVADWLRWKFRRFQLDRRDTGKWENILRVQLPERVRKIGPCPRTRTSEMRGMNPDPITEPVFKTLPGEGAGGYSSKRHLPDKPKASPKIRQRKQFGRGRPRKVMEMNENEAEQNDLAMLLYRYHDVINPLFARCQGDRDRMAVIYALRDMEARPGDRGAHERWRDILSKLGGV